MRHSLFLFGIIVTGLILSGQGHSFLSSPETPQEPFGRVEISFHYEVQDLDESNQYAVWIQDQNGRVVKTLFVTWYTADGGYNHQPCTPRWVNRANPRALPREEVDGFAGATPRSGRQVYKWDGIDREGNRVPFGNYVFVVEGSYHQNNRTLFTGLLPIGDRPVTVEAQAAYYPEDYEIFGSNMIERVEARYIPAP